MGNTNARDIRELQESHIQISKIDKLRQALLRDDQMVVGSANASINGMGVEGRSLTKWLQAGAVAKTQLPLLEKKFEQYFNVKSHGDRKVLKRGTWK